MDKGGRIRTYHMLKELKREHHVTYLALDDGNAAPDARERSREYCHDLITITHHTRPKFSVGFYLELLRNLFTPLPYFIMKYRSELMRSEIERVANTGRYDIGVCDFLQPSVNLPDRLPFPIILFQHNVEAMIWKRHYEVQSDALKRIYLYGQWRKAVAFEKKICRRVDCVVAVSAKDVETMRREYQVERIAEVPTGVDTDYFQPSRAAHPIPDSLVFTGSMDWLPNHDAVKFFVVEILPLIKEQLPQVKLTVVGRNPYPELLAMAERDNAINVTGRVEDVRPFIEEATAYIVPIRIGGGTRLKIYEAMAMEKPVVSTTVGAEGLPLRDGLELLLADSTTDFARAVVTVLKNASIANELARNAAKLMHEQFSWQRSAAAFAEICRQTTAIEASSSLRNKESLHAVS